MEPTQADPTLAGWRDQVRAVVFDLGGVIATSMGEALQGLVKAWSTGVSPSQERWRRVWRPLYTEATLGHIHPDELWRQFRQRIDLGSLPAGLEEGEFLSRVHLREPSIPQTLAELKTKYAVGLLSDYVGRWARALLERFGPMPSLDAVLISSDIGARRPAAVMYESICQLLDLAPAQAVYIGDEEEDMIGCQAVGMFPVFIPGQDSASSVGVRIEKVSDLLPVL
jgi:FMN phosphatase YigB (HAD superfamily)